MSKPDTSAETKKVVDAYGNAALRAGQSNSGMTINPGKSHDWEAMQKARAKVYAMLAERDASIEELGEILIERGQLLATQQVVMKKAIVVFRDVEDEDGTNGFIYAQSQIAREALTTALDGKPGAFIAVPKVELQELEEGLEDDEVFGYEHYFQRWKR